VKLNPTDVTIVQVYMPMPDHSDEELITRMHEKIEEILDEETRNNDSTAGAYSWMLIVTVAALLTVCELRDTFGCRG